MTVTNANPKNEVLEQVTIVRILETVSPDFRVWLTERKLRTDKELANKANEYVQARKVLDKL